MAAFKVLSAFQDVAPLLTFSIRPPGVSPPPRLLEGQLHDTSTKVTGEFVKSNQTNGKSERWWRGGEWGGGGEGEKKGEMKVQLSTSSFWMQITQKLRIQWIHFGLKIELTNQQSTWISFSVQHHLHCSAKTKKKKLPLDIPEFPFCFVLKLCWSKWPKWHVFTVYGTLPPQQCLWTELKSGHTLISTKSIHDLTAKEATESQIRILSCEYKAQSKVK